MELRGLLKAAAEPGRDRRQVYAALLAADLYVRAPARTPLAVLQPDTGRRAVPAFLQQDEAERFWAQATAEPIPVERAPLVELARAALPVGSLVIDPGGIDFLLNRAELMHLSRAEIPGEFAAYLRDLGRLSRRPAEVAGRLRRTLVHVIAGPGPDGQPRLYLLEKSDDGTLAVPCFSSAESLAQFAEVRRLFEGHHNLSVAMVEGGHVLQVASGMGAYVLIDPESPWETQLEPTFL
jgi:hypothetical protein